MILEPQVTFPKEIPVLLQGKFIRDSIYTEVIRMDNQELWYELVIARNLTWSPQFTWNILYTSGHSINFLNSSICKGNMCFCILIFFHHENPGPTAHHHIVKINTSHLVCQRYNYIHKTPQYLFHNGPHCLFLMLTSGILLVLLQERLRLVRHIPILQKAGKLRHENLLTWWSVSTLWWIFLELVADFRDGLKYVIRLPVREIGFGVTSFWTGGCCESIFEREAAINLSSHPPNLPQHLLMMKVTEL